MSARRRFWVRSIPQEQETPAAGWAITPLVRDYPGFMGGISVYYSTLAPGVLPHEIHHHPQEEIEVLLSGEMEVITPDHTSRIGPGSFHYQPAGQPHTIRGAGDEPARFVLLRWLPETRQGITATEGSVVFDASTLSPWTQQPGIQRQQLCPPLTLANGSRLCVYAAHWPENTGYRAHTDPFDVAIMLLRGRLAGLGHDTGAPAVIFYPAGAAHGISPADEGPSLALYFQFYPYNPDTAATAKPTEQARHAD